MISTSKHERVFHSGRFQVLGMAMLVLSLLVLEQACTTKSGPDNAKELTKPIASPVAPTAVAMPSPVPVAKPAPAVVVAPVVVPPVYTARPDISKSLASAAIDDTVPPSQEAGWTGNMAKNGGFEEDFINANGEGHVLSFKGDWYYNQRDYVPDYWDFFNSKSRRNLALDRDAPKGPVLGEGIGRALDDGQVQYWTWKQGAAHTGNRTLSLEQGISARQTFKRAITQWGGGAWGGVANKSINVSTSELSRFNLPWRASVWVRGGGTLKLGTVSQSVAAVTAPGIWQKIEVTLSPNELPAPSAALTVVLVGPGEFDDLVVQEQLPDSPNLVPNASFENAVADYPTGWSIQRKYRSIGPTYYTWTDWDHAFSPNRGAVKIDKLISHSGQQSVRFDVYPGDEKYIESAEIKLNQKELRVVEVGVWVRADRIRLIDVRAVDENGYWMASCRPSQPEYLKANPDGVLFGSGTFGWRYVRKFFTSAADQPIKAMRVRLCARGFNGHTLDDADTRAYDMAAGTVWWDDLRVYERTSTAAELRSRGVAVPDQGVPGAGRLADADIDLGERFVGENKFTYSFANNGGSGKYQIRLTTTLPDGQPQVTESPALLLRKGQRGRLVAPYEIERLAGELTRQATLAVELLCDGVPVAQEIYAFNTWPVVADIDVSRHYNLPEENPVTTSINLGLADATLNQVAKLELQLVALADNKVLSTVAITDLPKAFEQTRAGLPGAKEGGRYHHRGNPSDKGPEFNLPTPDWTVDRFNLIIRKLDLSPLKVWPHNYPVRDTMLVVRGLDKSGREMFRQTSDPFCRMAAPPKQEAIDKVEVRDDGAVLINGKPRYLFGASHQDFRLEHSPDRLAQLGLMGHRLPSGKGASFEALRALWDKGLYSLQAKPISGANAVKVIVDMTAPQREALEKFVKEGGMQNIVSLNTGGWEGIIDLDKPDDVEKHKQLNDWIRRTTGRPVTISTSGAFNAWWLQRYAFYDINFAETEMWGPMDFDVIYAPYMKRAGRKPAWVYLPQLYDNTPYERYRFETYANIIRGAAGLAMIQGIGDATFNRGLAGELRYLEAPLNSTEKRDDIVVEPNISHKATRYDGKTYILACNAGPIKVGTWNWHAENAFSGRASHDGDTANTQWYRPAGIRIHGFRGLPMPELIQKGDKIVQYVWIDPKEKPDWAMVCVRGDGRFAHIATLGNFNWDKFKSDDGHIILYSELEHSVWHEINWRIDDRIYERAKILLGQKEADQLKKMDKIGREKVEKIAYKGEYFHNAGKLPEAGTWQRIEIDAEKYGLVGTLVDGFAYLTQNGHALWDYSALERNGKVARVFCEDTVGIDRALLSSVRFTVPGLKAGARIRVLFENRELVADADGAFTDNFVGTDTYGSEGGAVLGDMFGFVKDPDRELVQMLPSGYGYTYGPTSVHIYEIGK